MKALHNQSSPCSRMGASPSIRFPLACSQWWYAKSSRRPFYGHPKATVPFGYPEWQYNVRIEDPADRATGLMGDGILVFLSMVAACTIFMALIMFLVG